MGTSSTALFSERAKAKNISEVALQSFTKGTTDVSTQIAFLKSSKARVFLFVGVSSDGVTVLKEA